MDHRGPVPGLGVLKRCVEGRGEVQGFGVHMGSLVLMQGLWSKPIPSKPGNIVQFVHVLLRVEGWASLRSDH